MEVTRLTSEQIDTDIVDNLSAGSLLTSRPFASLWETMGGRVVHWVARESSTVVGLLTGVEFGQGPLRRFQAMPEGIGGKVHPASGCESSRREISGHILKAVEREGYLKVHITDFDGQIAPAGSYDIIPCSTLLVDIESDQYEPPDRKLRSELRKAEREAVSIEPFDAGRNMSRFIELISATERRHGRRMKYPVGFYMELAKLAERDDRVIWLWCEHEGQPVVSHICLVEHKTALHWQVCYDKRFSFLKANQLMLRHLIKQLKDHGVPRLNLGASPDDAEGLLDYKVKWGGVKYDYNCYVHKSFWGRWL